MLQARGTPLAPKSPDSGALRAPIFTAIGTPQLILQWSAIRRATVHITAWYIYKKGINTLLNKIFLLPDEFPEEA